MRTSASVLSALVLVTLFAGVQPSSGGPAQPNIVLILTDDQRWDTLRAMPEVRSLLQDRGITFTNGFVSNPLCCPSRASILTGKYSHSTGVYTNNAHYHGGFEAFDDSSTIATWLDAAGYQTALVGKYMNLYDHTTYVPPGWDRWMGMSEPTGAYYDYRVNVDGEMRSYGHRNRDYSTDVFRDFAVDFIEKADPGDPLFLYYTPYAPHGTPIPANRHRHSFGHLHRFRPPSYNERDVSDKPAYIRKRPPFDEERLARIAEERRGAFQTLLAVDEAVQSIVGALADTGRLANTMIVFSSDNGLLWAEHRWNYKLVPYEESIRVPFVIRYDPLTAVAGKDSHVVVNIDLAPTFAELAGVATPGVEGQSLLPLLSGPAPPWRDEFLIENLKYPRKGKGNVPTYCAIRTEDFMYADYMNQGAELYKLEKDPYELKNVAKRPANDAVVQDLRARLAVLCIPPPPGYSL